MFKKNIALFLLFFFLFLCVWIYQTAFPHPNDIKDYKHILEQKAQVSHHNLSPTTQQRKNVQKDLWFSQGTGKRLHYQINSINSLLTFIPIKNKFEVVESLEGLKCLMQEKLIVSEKDQFPIQQIRCIEAQNGLYRFTTHELVANNVFLSLFRIPGHTIPKQPINKDDAYLQGIARNISCLFGGKTPQFQAEHFEAMMVKE